MQDIAQYIKSLAGLHDAAITELLWQPEKRSLEIKIDDLYAGFSGCDDYKGPLSARFTFSQVSKFQVDTAEWADCFWVFYWTVKTSETSTFVSEIRIWPAGGFLVECGTLECIKC